MKITDMNIDCLENCLEYLSLIDLLNAADSNQRLRHAARYVFVRIYSKNKVHLSLIKLMDKIWDGVTYKSGVVFDIAKELIFYDLKKGLQFLRCFGDLFSEIDIQFQHKNDYAMRDDQPYSDIHIQLTKSIEWESKIIEYINEYCSDSLINFKITNSPKGGLDKLTKPFKKIEKFETVGREPIFSNENKLNYFFPKIQELKLEYRSCTFRYGPPESYINFEFIVCNFPCLEHFTINIEAVEFNKQNIGNFLQLNPQLQYLAFRRASLSAILDSNNFENANEMFRDLQTLELLGYEKETANLCHQTIHLKKLKSLRVYFFDLDLTIPLNFPFATDCLESLHIQVCVKEPIHADIYNLIEKVGLTVKKITLCWCPEIEFNYARVSEALPLLEELCLLHFPFVSTVNEAVEIIQKFSSIKKFQFVFERILVPELQNRLHDTWSSQISQITGSGSLFNIEQFYIVSLERLI